MAVYTLRPNAAGDLTQLSQTPATGSNYDKVDESTVDDTDYVSNETAAPTNYKKDLYNLPALAIGSGTITGISVYMRGRKYAVSGSPWSYGSPTSRILIKTGGTEYSSDFNFGSGWSAGSATWATNPQTSVAWTIANINALQIGVELLAYYYVPIPGTTNDYNCRCSWLYVEVTVTDPTYVFPFDPMTRVTALVHRYDNSAGIYQLEMSLGDVTSVFAHSYELGARRATASKELVQETGRIFDVAKDERLLRKIPTEFTETRVVDTNGQDVTKQWKDFWSTNYQQMEKMVSDYFKRVTGGSGEKTK